MNWGSASEFFAMGGYGLYVWGSYAAVAVALVAEPWLAARQHRRALAAVAEAAQEMRETMRETQEMHAAGSPAAKEPTQP